MRSLHIAIKSQSARGKNIYIKKTNKTENENENEDEEMIKQAKAEAKTRN